MENGRWGKAKKVTPSYTEIAQRDTEV